MLSRLLAACALLLAALAAPVLPAAPAAASVVLLCEGLAPTQPPLLSSGTLVGTAGNDVLIGSSGDDVIKGGKGNDRICGGLGSDRIEGGEGSDTLIGEIDRANICPTGFGDDVLLGGPGDEYIFDLCGDNTAHGDTGRDGIDASGTADGGTGNDPSIFAYNGHFTCPGVETCVTGHARGGSGNDSTGVYGGDADGGSGNDIVIGTVAGDVVRGGSGADSLYSQGLDNMKLDGGSGWDTCFPKPGDLVIRCEA